MKPEERKSEKLKQADLSTLPDPDGISNRTALSVGMHVMHRVFGRGVIKGIGEENIRIQFGESEKQLLLETILSRRLLKEVEL